VTTKSSPKAESVLAAVTSEVAAGDTGPEAADRVAAVAGRHRGAVVEARDAMAARVGARVDDFEATAMLQLLNRTLSRMPIHDPLDWRVRWTQRFRRP
jgi:hypothetical protein